MFYLNRETELNIKLLTKMINSFNLTVKPKLMKYKNYYDGLQNIMNRIDKPKARLPISVNIHKLCSYSINKRIK